MRYILLALAFLLAIGGMFAGASTNDHWLMVLGTVPGLAAIVGLMLIWGHAA